jgi:hypothetical protein
VCVQSMYEKGNETGVAGGMTNTVPRITSPHLHRDLYTRSPRVISYRYIGASRAPVIKVGPAYYCVDTWTLQPHSIALFSLTVLVVAFFSSGRFFLFRCPVTIDGFGRRTTRGADGGGSSGGTGRRKEMISYSRTSRKLRRRSPRLMLEFIL